MATVTALGYVGVYADDPTKWVMFGQNVLGLPLASAEGAPDPSRPIRLRLDERAYRIEVFPAAEDGVGSPQGGGAGVVAHVGWECASEADWHGVLEQVGKAGIDAVMAPPEECRRQQVRGLAHVTDPAGYHLHLYYGQSLGPLPIRPTRPMTGFVTGAQGLGHVVLRVDDLAAATEFYCEVLGLRPTDYWSGVLAFLRCNRRHHSLALAEGDGGPLLFHMMLQVGSIDDVGLAQAACEEHGVQQTMTLGRHMNDRMLSFYMRTPSGFEIEYGCDPIEIDEASWSVREFPDRSIWGHRPLVPRSLRVSSDDVKEVKGAGGG